jgi:uncharacterized protein (TIGR04255 family)
VAYEDTCYTAPFLKEAIIRIDFSSPVESLSENLDKKLVKAALSKFPISEPQKIQTQELQFTGSNFSSNTKEITQWTFHGKNREKTLTIGPSSIAQVNKSYKTFELFIEDYLYFLTALEKLQPDLTISRVGVRYVNIIEATDGNPLEWKKYINERMLGIIDLGDKSEYVSRAFHILEYNFDSVNLKYQFGIANPDYPAPVKRKQFVLDLDAYTVGAMEIGDVEETIKDAHAKIQDFFELSITKATRDLMKPKKVKAAKK